MPKDLNAFYYYYYYLELCFVKLKITIEMFLDKLVSNMKILSCMDKTAFFRFSFCKRLLACSINFKKY